MNRLIEALRELAAPSAYRYAVRVAGLALAYFLAARIGLEYAVAHPVISTVWPASGIALAAVLLGGLRLVPAVFIGTFAVNYSIQGDITVSAITGLGNSLEVLLGTLLLSRVLDFDVRVSRLRDVVCLIVAAATISPLPAALLGPFSLALFGGLAWPEFTHAFRVWWMGDSLGIILISPLLLTWAARPALDWGSPRFWYVTILLAIQFTVCYAVFGGFRINDFGLSLATYFVLPFAVWIALAHDIRFTALANAGLFAIAVWGTAHGTGPFAGVSVETDLVLLNIFVVVYSITTLLVGAVNGERNRAVRDADSNAQRFRSLSAMSSDWYWEQDQNLRFTSISGSINDPAGLSGSQSVGKTRFELPNEFVSEEVRGRHTADLDARRPFRDLVLKRFRQDGQVHYALISGQPIFDSQGTFLGYRGVGRDITALKLAELALRENEERLRLQFQDMPIACIILDKSFLITDWNPAAERIFGFTKAGVIGRSPYDLVIPESARADVAGRIRHLQHGESSSEGISENIRKNGERIICQWRNSVLSNAAGELRGYMAMAEDVTAMVRAERAIRESEERFRALTDLSSDWYWEQDEQFRTSYMSPRYSARTGLVMKPTLGQTRFETDNIWESEEQKAEHRAMLQAHRPFRDLRLSRYDESGKLHYLSISGEPVFNQEGRFTGYRGIGRDVTEQKLAERALRASEERFRSLTELSSDWYWEQDAELRFTFVSSAIDAISGIDPSQRLARRRWEIPGLRFDPATLREHKELLAERKPFRDFRYIREMPDGQLRYISVTGTPLSDPGGKFTGYRGIGREVTAEVVAEQRTARLRDFYAALSKANSAIIHTTDERRLLGEICEVAVTYGRVIFARIGLIDFATGYLDDVAVAGHHQGYPQKAPISINPGIPEGQGPAGIALRTDAPYIGNDVRADQRNSRWHPAMLETGIQSMVVFPLHRGGRVSGSLHLYAAEKNWFDRELVALVTELAANISFALDNFEREAARQSTERALRESERRFRDIADAAGEFVWENDAMGDSPMSLRAWSISRATPRKNWSAAPQPSSCRRKTPSVWINGWPRTCAKTAPSAGWSTGS